MSAPASAKLRTVGKVCIVVHTCTLYLSLKPGNLKFKDNLDNVVRPFPHLKESCGKGKFMLYNEIQLPPHISYSVT